MVQEKTVSKNELKKKKDTSEASFPDEAFHLVDIKRKLNVRFKKQMLPLKNMTVIIKKPSDTW